MRKAAAGSDPTAAFAPVGRGGVEPPTFHFSGGRSYQLSYLPPVDDSAVAGDARDTIPQRRDDTALRP
jgi:hypothetical protein